MSPFSSPIELQHSPMLSEERKKHWTWTAQHICMFHYTFTSSPSFAPEPFWWFASNTLIRVFICASSVFPMFYLELGHHYNPVLQPCAKALLFTSVSHELLSAARRSSWRAGDKGTVILFFTPRILLAEQWEYFMLILFFTLQCGMINYCVE